MTTENEGTQLGIDATGKLVQQPNGPAVKEFVARSNAERLWVPRCFRCMQRRDNFDEQESFLNTFSHLLENPAPREVRERPGLNDAHWHVSYNTEYIKEQNAEKWICAECLVPFCKEKVAEFKRWKGKPGRKTGQNIAIYTMSHKVLNNGLIEATWGSPEFRFDLEKNKVVRVSPTNSTKIPPKKK